MVQLMNHASLSIDPSPKPMLPKNEKKIATSLFTYHERHELLSKTLKENITKLTNYFPTSLYNSFIFHFVEVVFFFLISDNIFIEIRANFFNFTKICNYSS